MTLVPPYPGSGWSSAEGPGRKIWGGGGSPPALNCSTAIAGAVLTDTLAETGGTFGPVSIPVSAAPFANALRFSLFSYVGPLMGGPALSVGGAGWSQLAEESDNGASAWIAVGTRFQAAIAAPPNMTVSSTASGGGFPRNFGYTFAIPSTAGTFVQQSPIANSGNCILPGAPTVGNLLISWTMCSETDADPTQWLAAGGSLLLQNSPHNGTQWWATVGVRCVIPGDTTTIRAPAGSHANYVSVSEWTP